MGDNDNLAQGLDKVQTTLASELGRLKADFVILLEKFEKLRDNVNNLQQSSSIVTQIDQRLQRASDEFNNAIRRIEAVEKADDNTGKYIERELQHLRTELLKDISRSILELDNSIKERLPATTIMSSIDELFSIARSYSESTQRLISEHGTAFSTNYRDDFNTFREDLNETVTTNKRDLETRLDKLETKIGDANTKLANFDKEQTKLAMKIAMIAGGILLVLQTVVTIVIKSAFEPRLDSSTTTSKPIIIRDTVRDTVQVK